MLYIGLLAWFALFIYICLAALCALPFILQCAWVVFKYTLLPLLCFPTALVLFVFSKLCYCFAWLLERFFPEQPA